MKSNEEKKKKTSKKKSKSGTAKEQTESFTHDRFVYDMWSDIPFAKLFFKYFLPEPILNVVDLETLKSLPTRSVNKRGREQTGDLFYEVGVKQGSKMILVILMEHKSTFDPYASIQMLRYEAAMFDHMARNKKIFKNEQGLLPAPVSILLCQDDHPQLDELLYRVEGLDYGSHFRFFQVNIQKIDFKRLKNEGFLRSILRIVRYSKNKRKDPNDRELLEAFLDLINCELPNPETASRYLETTLNYAAWFMRKTTFSPDRFKQVLFDQEQENTIMPKTMREIFHVQFEELLDAKTSELREQVEQSATRAAQLERQNQSFLQYLVETIHNKLRIKFEELTFPKKLDEKLFNVQTVDTLREIDSLIESSKSYKEFLRRAYKVLD